MKPYVPIIYAFFLLISFIDLFSMDFNKSSDIETTKHEELMYRSRSHFDNNPDSTIILADMAYKYSQDIRERGYVLETKGIAYLLKGNHKIGFKKLGEAYVCFRNENYKNGLISLYIDLGKYYLLQNQYKNSIKYYLKAKEIAVKAGIDEELPTIYKSLGDIYCLLQDYSEAVNCFNTLLSINKNNDKEVQAMCSYNIGRIYFETDNFTKADSMFQLCKKINLPKDAHNYLTEIYQIQGNIELNNKRYLQAEIFYEKSLAFPQSRNDSFITISSIVGSQIINGRKNIEDIELKKYHNLINEKEIFGDHYKNIALAYYIKKQNDLGDLYFYKAKQVYSEYNCLKKTLSLISIKERYTSNIYDINRLLKEKDKIKEKINKQQTEMLHVQNEFDALFIKYIDRINNNLQKEKQMTELMLIISISIAIILIILFAFFIIIRNKNFKLKMKNKQLVDSNDLINKAIVTELRKIYHKSVNLESLVSPLINKDTNKSLKYNFNILFENITNLLNLLIEQKNKH